ncbi:ASKHA domain-containing protein [Desulfallas thermosapovorans]|uniref:Uncharacterized 2Fe-2S/4Fe-4S cluster protein (DUF4445 family) n=1 Tax=Desulfallas thermosapovorans DSM 6562 TaxID=1121431 RepID=A0A5S4ZV51_9FIRM|nr:ASKHA domain-containing protein [Desulfallas thermosapovorans]TYO96861.1 uncharacterized 2Fe-2S/4Fe-4S cluster protein (DUF4445 family) [Desulfallas thermosapovorans DSM 6562]
MSTNKVRFLPDDITIAVESHETILDAAVRAGIAVKSSCGGAGTCSRCRVITKSGQARVNSTGKLTEEELARGYALACQTYPQSDMEIEIPETSRLAAHQVLTSQGQEFDQSITPTEPLFKKIKLQLLEPSLDDHVDDMSRLYSELNKMAEVDSPCIDLEIIQKLPQTVRKGNWKVTVSLADIKGRTEIVNIEPGWDYKKYYGLALDIGTTTVVAHLVDLESGESLGVEGTYNKQAVFGDDVISRIIYAVEHKKGLEQMQTTIITTINELIDNLVEGSHVDHNDIWYITCAANTTMTHLFLGIDPEYIRLEPYVPAFNSINPITAADLSIKANPKARIYCLPGIASYVGGDITAGVEVTGIDKQDDINLFIDVGTNGEMVLGNSEWLVACACSAGPAFEGGGIAYGMRAMDGAIEHIRVTPGTLDVYWETVGNKKPVGICGSGLIDCISTLREAGVIDRTGNFLPLPANERVQIIDGEKLFILVPAEESGTGTDITISQTDIKDLIRSKAAVFAGVQTMLKTVGLPVEAIERVYIAGGFGRYINLHDAINIGMFPDLPLERYKYIGNSSVKGAKMALLSKEARREAEKLAEKITYIELSIGNDFMEEFVSALFIPHTNVDLFPSINQACNPV